MGVSKELGAIQSKIVLEMEGVNPLCFQCLLPMNDVYYLEDV
jgi:hypothetical protein